jgi:16S rRNA (guanine966-N2)-methyltransferase
MRIIAGKWANRSLVSPGGRVRPTAEPVRHACMALLGTEIEGARVLDLFAGTGALGLEALSRGARSCDFVENGAAAMHSLRANVAALRARRRSRIFDRDAIPFVGRLPAGAYDIAFADPPYGSKKLDRVIERWLEAPFARLLCLEHAPDHALPVRGRRKAIGDSAVTLVRRESCNGPESTGAASACQRS